MLTRGPEVQRAMIYSQLYSLAAPFTPPYEEQVRLARDVLAPIGESVVQTPTVGRSRVSHALSLLESHARIAQDSKLRIRGVATLVRLRNSDTQLLRTALDPEEVVDLFQGVADRVLQIRLRRLIGRQGGNLNVNREEIRQLAQQGIPKYRICDSLMTLIDNLGALLPPSSPSASSV